MIQTQIPRSLLYQRIIPRGFPCVYKEWRLDPMTSNKYWVNNDIVRFNFYNNSSGVFDPYRSYIQITVSCDTKGLPVGLLQIDNSAQSFIQQMVLYSNNRQVQRIVEYSVLAAYLTDVGMTQMVAQGRQAQGFGYGSFDTMPYQRSTFDNSISMKPRGDPGGTQYSLRSSPGLILPTMMGQYMIDQGDLGFSLYGSMKNSKSHVSSVNPFITGSDVNRGQLNNASNARYATWQQTGNFGNIRSQYASNFIKNNYIQSTDSIPCFQLSVDQNVFLQGGYDQAWRPTDPFVIPKNISGTIQYTTTPKSQLQQKFVFQDTTSDLNNHQITTSNFGFSSLFSPAFSRGTFQPFISPTVRQGMLYQGRILQTKEPLYRRRFKIPLLSGIIGILIDPQTYMLLPLKAIDKLMMQLTLDPYAMFTSGYKDICEMDDSGMGFMQQRNWQIDRIQYKIHTYHYRGSDVNAYIQTSLLKQITFVSNFWSLGNQYQVPGGKGPGNTYIVGCNSTNLNQLVCLFVSNDYQVYSFCRKHFRLSNNITRFWAKLGVDYWPPQPHRGNGGNPISNQMQDDNLIFVENIYWANNYMFSTSTPLPRINIYNFALNQRPYNVGNRLTMYPSDLLGDKNYVFTQQSINYDTALGMAYIHQNRAVGKAAYNLSFSPYVQDQGQLRGINVSGLSNFQVVFQCSAKNAFPRDQTLYIYCKSSVIVKLTNQGIETYGR